MGFWAKVVGDENRSFAGEVMRLIRYIVRPQRRAKSQRITLPLELTKDKKWLDVDCYIIMDRGADFVTLTPYSTAIITEVKQKKARRYR